MRNIAKMEPIKMQLILHKKTRKQYIEKDNPFKKYEHPLSNLVSGFSKHKQHRNSSR